MDNRKFGPSHVKDFMRSNCLKERKLLHGTLAVE